MRHDLPPPQPARFINPIRSSRRSSGKATSTEYIPLAAVPDDPHMTSHDIVPLYDASMSPKGPLDTADVSDELKRDSAGTRRETFSSHVRKSRRREWDGEECQCLLSKGHGYPLGDLKPPTSILLSQRPSSATLVQRRHLEPHTPIPATIVFSRNAAPLHLLKLDKYISSLSSPSSALPSRKEKGQEKPMFPPMDRLVASNRTLDDLERNSRISPDWRSRRSILRSLVNVALGLTGSSILSTFYSLQGLSNTVQIFALILSTIIPVGRDHLTDKWRKLFLGTIPNVLALNFASTIVQSLVLLIIFMAICAVMLYYFYRSTTNTDRHNAVEGLQQPVALGNQWGLVIVSFLLTVIYLPLSTMAVHVLVWSRDLWVAPDPYLNVTASPASVPPSDELRDTLDFCWTTTMRKNEINFAPIVIIISAIVFLVLTVWFPLSLRQVIKQSVPKVDPYTELGRRRNESDMDREYQRLLERDNNPFAFLYSGFRRNWGTFQATYLGAKLSTLLIIAVLDPDNCLFRSLSRSHVAIARQCLLLVSTIAFFILQCCVSPFLDPVNNANEWTSRLNYVATAAVALGVSLNLPGKNVLNGTILYIIYIVTYGLSIFNLSVTHRLVKRLARRIDFSIDIFSPRLDISSSSPHTKRRIWQESITTLFLTSHESEIPEEQRMVFAQARESEYPPYLLGFRGSPGERHVENLKILREVGSVAYNKAVTLVSGPDFVWFKRLEEQIQKNFIGPDCYWKNASGSSIPGCTKYFGNAWWIPFPPTLVLKYDNGSHVVLREVPDFELYISQNSDPDVQRRRDVRISLRALEGQTVIWPYEHKQPIGGSAWCCTRKRYKAYTTVLFQSCVLKIKRHGHLIWQDLQWGSGFDVELTYSKTVRVDGGAIGLVEDYDLTQPLARFLSLNRDLIRERVPAIEAALDSYRQHYWKESHWKTRVMTYRFLSSVYDQPRDPIGLAESSIESERDPRVRRLMIGNEAVFRATYERLSAVTSSRLATWWYIFWDDLWRRNHDTLKALELHASDFNPHYLSSIAYTPLPRSALETFLIQRGLMSKRPKWSDVFHSGFLNKLYLRLNEIVFHGSSRAIMFHVGNDTSELDMEDVDVQTQHRPSSLGTGGGTDHDDVSIRARPEYRWEGILNEHKRKRRWFAKMGAWFGITPLWRSGTPPSGLSLDVKLEKGKYVLIEEVEDVS